MPSDESWYIQTPIVRRAKPAEADAAPRPPAPPQRRMRAPIREHVWSSQWDEEIAAEPGHDDSDAHPGDQAEMQPLNVPEWVMGTDGSPPVSGIVPSGATPQHAAMAWDISSFGRLLSSAQPGGSLGGGGVPFYAGGGHAGPSVAQAFAGAPAGTQTDAKTLLGYYRDMLLIRRFEEKSAEMYTRGKIGGFLHLAIGEEPVCVGAISTLQPHDHIITHYRDHGHALARGLDPNRVMAELCGKATGVCGGRGGSMHLCDVKLRFWGGYAIVGAHLPMAAGIAYSEVYHHKTDGVVLCIFGDGSTNTGEFHETLNIASLWKLPVIFLCENNLYGMGTAIERHSAVPEIYKRAAAYDIPAERVDGMDLFAVQDSVRRAAELGRKTHKPSLIEAVTYRFRGHSMADPELYRERDEVEEWKRRDPLRIFQERLIQSGVATKSDIERIHQEVEQTVEEAARFADESPEPSLDTLFDGVYTNPIPER